MDLIRYLVDRKSFAVNYLAKCNDGNHANICKTFALCYNVFLMVLFAALCASQVWADGLCNTTIYKSMTLETDLNCSDGGIEIGSDNVALDCNGHTIYYGRLMGGNGLEARERNNVSINNCKLVQKEGGMGQYFANAIFFYSVNNSRIQNVEITTFGTSSYGMSFFESENNAMEGCRIATHGSSGGGINLANSDNNIFRRTVVSTSGASSHAVRMTGSKSCAFINAKISTSEEKSPGFFYNSNGIGLLQTDISCSGSESDGIILQNSTLFSLANSAISVSGEYSYDLRADSSPKLQVNASSLTALGTSGALLLSFSPESRISSSNISTSGVVSEGGESRTPANAILLSNSENCQFVQINVTTKGKTDAIRIFSSQGARIKDSAISTRGDYANALNIETSPRAMISLSSISTYGRNSNGIILFYSPNTAITLVNISSYGLFAENLIMRNSLNTTAIKVNYGGASARKTMDELLIVIREQGLVDKLMGQPMNTLSIMLGFVIFLFFFTLFAFPFAAAYLYYKNTKNPTISLIIFLIPFFLLATTRPYISALISIALFYLVHSRYVKAREMKISITNLLKGKK